MRNIGTILMSISPILLLLFFVVIPHWKWFFQLDVLTYGDWWFHHTETTREWLSVPYIWSPYGLGGVFLSIFMYPVNLLWGLLSIFFNFALIERLLYLWPSLLFSLIGYVFFARKILKFSSPAMVIGSIVFIYNTYFILGRTGHFTLMVGFALLPLAISLFILLLREQRTIGYLGSLLFVLALIGAYEIRVLYLCMIVFALYSVYAIIFIKRDLKIIFSLLYIVGFLILINIYWLIPLVSISSVENNHILARGLFGNHFMHITRSLTLFHPFWTGERPAIFEVQLIPVYFWFIPLFAILGILLNRRNRYILFFGILSLLGIFLSKQVGHPFPNSYIWLFENFPGFRAFREASKFYAFVGLGYSVLIGAFVDWMWRNWTSGLSPRITKFALTFFIAMLFLWNAKPLVTSEIGTLFVSRNVPSDYSIYKNFILEQSDDFRSLWIPRVSRWSIYTSNKPVVSFVQTNWECTWEFEPCTEILGRNISGDILDNSAVKYVVVPVWDTTNEDDFFIHYGKARGYYINILDDLDYLEKIDIGTEELTIYENQSYRSRLYLNEKTNLEYSMINPTEYSVKIEGLSTPNKLYFSETYHPEWKLRVGNFRWINSVFDVSYFLPDDFHSRTDAGYNSFFLNIDYIKANLPEDQYKVREDGSLDLELTIFFEPQSYVYLGLIVSGFTLTGGVGYLFVVVANSLWKRYHLGKVMKEVS